MARRSATTAGMAELRRLIVGEEERRVADVLPSAVALGAKRDKKLAFALAPMVADTLGDVARTQPEKLSDALQPIIGKAVRKAVAAAFAALVQRVNLAMEQTLSIRSIRWRIEAARTGRPFAEILLLHSMVFRVEQVFLVHRRTGLLLSHAAMEPEATRDPDQVAAMLNVIERFVHDAFREGATLTRFEVGDLVGRSEIGAQASITAIVRGVAPEEELGQLLRDALERIQLGYGDALREFGGDTAPFAGAGEVLNACLLERRRERKRSPLLPVTAGLLGVALLVLVGVLVVRARAAEQRFRGLERALREQPGIVITSAERDGQRIVIRGLRDPLAEDPAAILSARGLDPSQAVLAFEPFYSSDRRLVEKRVVAALSPPRAIGLAIDRGTLRIAGIAPREWVLRARLMAGVLPGVTAVDTSAVREREAVDLVADALPRIEGTTFFFERGSAALASVDDARLDALARDVLTALTHASAAGVRVRAAIDGSADALGSVEDNRRLSLARAEALAAALARRGVPANALVARVEGETASVPSRRVVVRVLLEGAAIESPAGGASW